MLTSLCNELSSADIVHLGATCREARTYVLESANIFQQLKVNAKCDGSGIVARKRVFGHQLDYECLEGSERPCADCGAMVCDECRFHLNYGCIPDKFSDAEEREELKEIEREHSKNIQRDSVEDRYLGTKNLATRIEARKAGDIWGKRFKTYCLDCHPLLVRTEPRSCCRSPSSPEEGLFEHFVGNRWLCLPCFFVEERKSIEEHKVAVTGYSPTSGGFYKHAKLCDCGKLPHKYSSETCKYCNVVLGCFLRFEEEVILPKILDQLGYEKKMEGEMAAIYAQLG